MKCPSCNKENNYYHNYCYFCGAKLPQEDSEVQETQDVPEKQLPEEHTQKTPSPKDSEEVITDYKDNPEEEYMVYSRRARKRKPKGSGATKWVVTICLFIIAIAIFAFAFYVFYNQFINPSSKSDDTEKITASFSIKAEMLDGKPVHRLIVQTPNGELVKVLDKAVPVKDGRADVILQNDELMNILSKSENKDSKIILDVKISKAGLHDKQFKVSFGMIVPETPLKILQPANGEDTADSNEYIIRLQVNPGASVYINNDNYTDLIKEDGNLEAKMNIPDQPETLYEIKASQKGFNDNVQKVVIKKGERNSPITINEKQPIKTSEDWVSITGKIPAGASLEVNRSLKSQPQIDQVTGNFRVDVQLDNLSLTPCTIKITEDGKEDYTTEVVIERSTTANEYTSKAWEFKYDLLKSDSQKFNGKTFLVAGKIKEILNVSNTGKTTFLVDVSPNGDNSQLAYIEYWGNKKLQEGQNVRVFGNRWGNDKDGHPRILTQFVY